MLSGTNYIGANHLLPDTPSNLQATLLIDLGGTNRVASINRNDTVVNIQTVSNVATDTDFDVIARL